jgi:spore germination cell wall hydrolase CwlJ-like protein
MSKKMIANALAALALALCIPTTIASPAKKARQVKESVTYASVDPRASERACLVAAAWNEARGAPDTQVTAVMHVVVNRTKHPAFAKTICGVVLEKGQFSMSPDMRNSVIESKKRGEVVLRGVRPAERGFVEKMEAIASLVIDGDSVDPTRGATHFYCPQLRKKLGFASPPMWAKKLPMTLSLGPFRFHRL